MYQKKNRELSPVFVAYVKGEIACTRLTTGYYLDQSTKQSRYLAQYDLTKLSSFFSPKASRS